jgi:hypothetical protein
MPSWLHVRLYRLAAGKRGTMFFRKSKEKELKMVWEVQSPFLPLQF